MSSSIVHVKMKQFKADVLTRGRHVKVCDVFHFHSAVRFINKKSNIQIGGASLSDSLWSKILVKFEIFQK